MYMFSAELRLAILFAFVGFIIYLVARHVRAQSDLLRVHLEGRNRLLDRFGDAEAFLTFARSDEGRALLRTPEPIPGTARVPGLRLLQSAAVSLATGVGFTFFSGPSTTGGGQEAQAIGVVLLSAGIGLALAGLLARAVPRASRSNRP